MTLTIETARELLDLGARLRKPSDAGGDPPQAVEQLRGAVAIHNILQRQKVAYLADEVGMGKTYVALAAIALFRHFNPNFRVAVIAPRENIQIKWMKEWFNFSKYLVQVRDMRVQGLDGGPARPLVKCDSLRAFVRETALDPERDFFLRLSSFSLATGDDESNLKEARQRFRQ
ncbi:MAG: DEAD/DEAH box helicase family protein, partial [Desulfobacterales bacterium]|nr:DEAD/DEAH box helicase family protein [Desulfobacterales bacterium]